jgi:hypothetical protein
VKVDPPGKTGVLPGGLGLGLGLPGFGFAGFGGTANVTPFEMITTAR